MGKRALVVLFAAIAVVVSGPAAYAKCNPGRTDDFLHYYFDGWRRQPGSYVDDITSHITNYSPYVTRDYTSAWVMLTKTGTYDVYAQIGWWEYPNDVRQTFMWIHNSGQASYYRTWAAEPANSTALYEVTFNPQNYWFNFTEIGPNGYSTANRLGNWTPTEGQMFGELHTKANQMPGATAVTEQFDVSSIDVWDPVTQSYVHQAYNGNPENGNWNWWGLSVPPGGWAASIWEKACTS